MATVPAGYRAKKLAVRLGADASAEVDAMLARQNLSELPFSRRDLPLGAIGCLGDAELLAEGNVCFFTGMPINGPSVDELTDAESAARLFPLWDGAFTGIFWDAEREILVVATDCLGIQPLYMRQAEGELTLVSETKAVGGAPDLAAWGAFISIGHPIGERSLIRGLKRVPPASILVYDCKQGSLAITRYWEGPEPSDSWRSYDFLGALEAEIKAYAAVTEPGTLLLSGGFDSRLLLLLLKRARIPVDALIVAHDDELGNADGRLAEQAARMAEIPYRVVCPPHDFFSSPGYLQHLVASDAGYPSLGLFISKIVSQIDSAVIWDGLIPGFMFNASHQPGGGYAAYRESEIEGHDSAIWRAAGSVFEPDVVEAMFEGFAADLRAEFDNLPGDEYGLTRFIVENRVRNRVSINPHKVYGNRATALTPGLSKDFISHAAVIPFENKKNASFYPGLFAQLDRRATRVPIVSGGNLFKGARFSTAYYRECLYREINKYRVRYPSLFDRGRRTAASMGPMRSVFLRDCLLDPEDQFLNPQLGEQLRQGGDNSNLAWKLLFHWRAWHWVHEGRLFRMLDE